MAPVEIFEPVERLLIETSTNIAVLPILAIDGVMQEAEVELKTVAGEEDKVPAYSKSHFTSETVGKFAPVIIISVPPARDPKDGEIFEIGDGVKYSYVNLLTEEVMTEFPLAVMSTR